MKAHPRYLVAGLVLLGALAAAPASFAGAGNPTHLKHHPRVNQVNRRVRRQHARIKAGVQSGKLSPQQAAQLRAERKGLKTEERAMRKADGGHLTKSDQKILNQQLDQRSQQIYNEKH